MQMAPMWVLGGLSAGWLAENFLGRRGYGLIGDLLLGVSASLVGGCAYLALIRDSGMMTMLGIGFVVATALILAQRLFWPNE